MAQHQLRAVEQRGGVLVRRQYAARDFHHGHQLEGLHRPDAMQPAEVGRRPADEGAERAGRGEQLLREGPRPQARLYDRVAETNQIMARRLGLERIVEHLAEQARDAQSSYQRVLLAQDGERARP